MDRCFTCSALVPSDVIDPDTGMCIDCTLAPTLTDGARSATDVACDSSDFRLAVTRDVLGLPPGAAIVVESPTESGVRWGR